MFGKRPVRPSDEELYARALVRHRTVARSLGIEDVLVEHATEKEKRDASFARRCDSVFRVLMLADSLYDARSIGRLSFDDREDLTSQKYRKIPRRSINTFLKLLEESGLEYSRVTSWRIDPYRSHMSDPERPEVSVDFSRYFAKFLKFQKDERWSVGYASHLLDETIVLLLAKLYGLETVTGVLQVWTQNTKSNLISDFKLLVDNWENVKGTHPDWALAILTDTDLSRTF